VTGPGRPRAAADRVVGRRLAVGAVEAVGAAAEVRRSTEPSTAVAPDCVDEDARAERAGGAA
jgi:hypothetical protein